MKELGINLDYLASTYGFDHLEDARIESTEDGTRRLVLEGTSKSEPGL